MTSKERVEKLRCLITCMKCEVSGKECDNNCPTQYDTGNMGEIIENLEEIAKALEQEPCEDAVSRQAVIDAIKEYASMIWKEYLEPFPESTIMEIIQALPSVKPQPKTGHNCNKDYADCDQFVCSECGIELQDWHKVVRDDEYDDISYQEYAFRFCPSCGCEIKEV